MLLQNEDNYPLFHVVTIPDYFDPIKYRQRWLDVNITGVPIPDILIIIVRRKR